MITRITAEIIENPLMFSLFFTFHSTGEFTKGIVQFLWSPTQTRLVKQHGVMWPVAKKLRACSDVHLEFNSEELDYAAVGR